MALGKFDIFVNVFMSFDLHPVCVCVGGGGRRNTPYSLLVVKGDQKRQREGSEKPLLCILFYEKTRNRKGGYINVSLNPKCLVRATLL